MAISHSNRWVVDNFVSTCTLRNMPTRSNFEITKVITYLVLTGALVWHLYWANRGKLSKSQTLPLHSLKTQHISPSPTSYVMPFVSILDVPYREFPVQSTPVISRLLGAKIHERELSGSPIISHFRAKAMTREFRITDPHSGQPSNSSVHVER